MAAPLVFCEVETISFEFCESILVVVKQQYAKHILFAEK